ncbi:serine/threonine-protein kinase [Streptomyces phyllanthi]|uniref:Serine/threonine protein kinase n=1 Tax=Streptomyces phyllanthi TaxID=1803180 RepID=A0A5N8WDQ5_9ACTN|nr:serine/threonine-protein kinase [Streptomyces phyllanthi]MPY45580.1 serine/threonine protein kinase [Streptomyces phyllanthi]
MEKLGAGDPHRIGAYRLLARLGAGGMGNVYLARSDRGRTVAVKLVRQELAEQEEFRARFRQEVQAARRVGGYWTAPVLDADTEADIPWVATGYVAGPSLQTVVGRDHGALPERSVRILAAGLAHALKDIHAAGLIHRDLKPSNVLVTIDGPRVIDFGIARALETVIDGGLTRTGALVGSPGFMAPEQVRGDRITPACDVFCLGSVLSYAATGTLPFGSANSGVHALMFRIAQEEPDLANLPEGLSDLVRDCLRKDPAARPTLDRILERTGAEDTVLDGRSRDPWLPGSLVAQLGRHAVRLLDTENPEETGGVSTPEGAADTREVAPPTNVRPPEHAPTPPPPGQPGQPGAAGTQVEGFGQAPPPAAPPAAYGYPQQHPQPATGYGPPQAQSQGQGGGWGAGPYGAVGPAGPAGQTLGPTPPYGPGATHPYGPYGPGADRPPEPPSGGGRTTAALIVVALVVALAAGGSVYALMQGGSGQGGDDKASPTPSAPRTPGPSTSEPSPTATGEPATKGPEDGAIPEEYLGTWNAAIDNATGHNTRRLVIRQGEVGDTVLSLTADGPSGSGTYHCVFEAELAEAPTDDGPLRMGSSTVRTGEPETSCSPGDPTELTILSDGRLRRVNTQSGEALTYTKAD